MGLNAFGGQWHLPCLVFDVFKCRFQLLAKAYTIAAIWSLWEIRPFSALKAGLFTGQWQVRIALVVLTVGHTRYPLVRLFPFSRREWFTFSYSRVIAARFFRRRNASSSAGFLIS